MKKRSILFILLFLFVVCGADAFAQEKSSITVRGSDLNSGVVILDVVKGEKTYKLQCNQGAPNCTMLKSGDYRMVELPENFGLYECKDVEIYPGAVGQNNGTPDKDKDKKIGEYCLVEK